MDKPDFTTRLCQKREKCSHNSAVTHWYQIRRLLKIAGKKSQKIPKTSTWLTAGILDKLKKLTLVVQRNLTTSALVYLQLLKSKKSLQKVFSERMYAIVKEIRVEQKKNPNTRSLKQTENWLTKKEIDDFWKERLEVTNGLLRKRGELNKSDYNYVRDTILVCIHLGISNPPPRLDYATATYTENENSPLENDDHTRIFYKKGRLYAKIYGKTKTAYGATTITLHTPLSTLLGKWLKKTGMLGHRVFLSDRRVKFSPQTYGSHLRKIFERKFGKRVGASLLRSMYISNKWANLPKILRAYERDARQMMHSTSESMTTYLKNTL